MEYNQEFSAYNKTDVIRQKRAGIYRKLAEKFAFSVIP
jgi:glutathione peroxidase-family protein